MQLQSSDDDSPALEEQLVVEELKKRATSLAMEDFGLQDAGDSEDNEDESDKGLTLEVGFANCQFDIFTNFLDKSKDLDSKNSVLKVVDCHPVNFLQEISIKGKSTTKPWASKEAVDDAVTSYEEVKKDLNALSKEEQMDVVYRYNWAAPSLLCFSYG